MSNPNTSLVWRKSGRCANSACVEVAEDGPLVLVRDSKEDAGAVLTFDRSSWSKFIAEVAVA